MNRRSLFRFAALAPVAIVARPTPADARSYYVGERGPEERGTDQKIIIEALKEYDRSLVARIHKAQIRGRGKISLRSTPIAG